MNNVVDISSGKKKYATGDQCRIKSGGPTMTVHEVQKEGDSETIHCRWFSDINELETAMFNPEELEPVE